MSKRKRQDTPNARPVVNELRGNDASVSDGTAHRVLILCPQGGTPEAEYSASIGGALVQAGRGDVDVSIVCLRHVDADAVRHLTPSVHVLKSFEEFRRESPAEEVAAEALRLAREYPGVNWWEVVAAERSLIDSSFLVGGLGQRRESHEYVEALVVDLVRHLETIFAHGRFSAVVCPVADSLIIHIFYQVARKFGAQVLALAPSAWIREDGRPGFYIGRDEFMHNDRMEEAYCELGTRGLTDRELDRARRFQRTV